MAIPASTQYQLPPEVSQARQRAQELTGVAGQYKAAEPSVTDVLRQKVTEAFANNQDIVQPLDTATQNYLQAPQTARVKYQDIFNPFQREQLVSQYQGNQALPMQALSNIYGGRLGRIQDLLGAGISGYQAAGNQAALQAQQAQGMYENLFNEYKTTQDLANQSRQLDISEYNALHPSGGGAGSNSPYDILIAEYLRRKLNPPSNQMQGPPSSSVPGAVQEWPVGSGIYYDSDGQGGWM